MRNLAAFTVAACVLIAVGAEAWALFFAVVGMKSQLLMAAVIFLFVATILMLLERFALKSK